MTISQIVEFLEKLKVEKGDIPISCDFRWYDKDGLYYADDLTCIFGE